MLKNLTAQWKKFREKKKKEKKSKNMAEKKKDKNKNVRGGRCIDTLEGQGRERGSCEKHLTGIVHYLSYVYKQPSLTLLL